MAEDHGSVGSGAEAPSPSRVSAGDAATPSDCVMGVHIYAPQPELRAVNAGVCLDCGRRTRFIGTCTPWYGWTSTCLRCGRRWCDGEWMPLEFERGSRTKSIASAKRSYRRAIGHTELLRPEGIAGSSDDTREGACASAQNPTEPKDRP